MKLLDYGNTLDDIMKAFGMDIDKRNDWMEFKAFWNSLTDEERDYYRYANLGD